MVRVLVVLLAGGEILEGSPTGLALSKPCLEKTCTLLEYCSSVDHMCHNCADICEQSHNYDAHTCETNCQDYIHDKLRHYIKGGDTLNSTNFQETIDWLRFAVAGSLSISCIAALGLLALVCYLCLKRNIVSQASRTEKDLLNKKMSAVSAIFNNNKEEKEKELRIDMPTTGAPSVVTATTPISTRHPSEDATLEYAYDNPNLTPSPQLPPPRHETTF